MDEESSRPKIGDWWRGLAHEQKISALILGVCGLLTVVLAVVHVRGQLTAPFMVPKTLAIAAQKTLDAQTDDVAQMEKLKTTDTDHDGLSDYDELYVYHTSPYLPDTDSDGIPDLIEIARGTDPNCPKGEACTAAADLMPVTATSSGFQDLLNTPLIPQGLQNAALGTNASSVAGVESFLTSPPTPESMTPAQIRTYLISNHIITEADLKSVPDADMKAIYSAAYQEALRIQQARQGLPVTTPENAPLDLTQD